MLILWFICPIIAAIIASRRGKDKTVWFLLGILVGPFAILGAAIGQPGASCPHCRSTVHSQATKCPKCQSQLEPRSDAPKELIERLGTSMKEAHFWPQNSEGRIFLWILCGIIAIVLLLSAR